MMSINKNIQSEILMTAMEENVHQDSLFLKVDKYRSIEFRRTDIKFKKCDFSL